MIGITEDQIQINLQLPDSPVLTIALVGFVITGLVAFWKWLKRMVI